MNPFSKSHFSLFSPQSVVSIYTVLSILIKMKDRLGLEAMLEYVGNYLNIIEKNNPRLKSAVNQALTMMSVEKMYEDAIGDVKE